MRAHQVDHADAARDERGAAFRAGEQRADLGGVAGVVQEDQDAAAVERGTVERRAFFQGVGDRRVGRAERAQERAEDRLRFRRARAGALKVDVQLAVGEGRAGGVGHVDGERRLSYAADSGHRRHRHDLALPVGGGGGRQDVAQFGHE